MKVLAQVVKTLDVVSGQSDNGNYWEKQTVIVDTLEMEPKRLAIEFMGEKKTATTKKLQAGEKIEVVFGIHCHEYMGKWYTRLDGGYIKQLEAAPTTEAAPAAAAPAVEMPDENEKLF